MAGVLNGDPLVGLDLSLTTHTNAGTYSADAWTFTDGTGNYNDASGTVSDSIAKADAAIVVTGYSVTYDARPTPPPARPRACNAESLAGLDLTGTTHTNAGTYATDPWTFTDTPATTTTPAARSATPSPRPTRRSWSRRTASPMTPPRTPPPAQATGVLGESLTARPEPHRHGPHQRRIHPTAATLELHRHTELQ